MPIINRQFSALQCDSCDKILLDEYGCHSYWDSPESAYDYAVAEEWDVEISPDGRRTATCPDCYRTVE